MIGVQRDERIVVENTQNTEKGETVGTLIISHILRTDDGLYECIATNEVSYFVIFDYTLEEPVRRMHVPASTECN